jgi:hypothetical protein
MLWWDNSSEGDSETTGARWHETPTGIRVPIPPISGGSDAAVAPAPTPAAPAPVDSAPGSAAPISPGSVASPRAAKARRPECRQKQVAARVTPRAQPGGA